ncbi:MAG: 3'-5' exonuclease [Lachnospiraceae bacterium]|nr:3'-5' exonuclease [Lachnospiraceae bacterium]
MTDSYISIDLETTGLEPKHDKIIEIGALQVEKGQITDSFSTFVNPGRKLEERITELTGIRDEDLADAPYIQDVLPKLLAFVGDLPLLGHSILFDFSFLKKAAVNQKLSFERGAVDTLKIARKYLPELESRSLDYLCKYYEIPHKAHRALEDARATHLLYGKLVEQFGGKEPAEGGLFVPVQLNYQVKRDTPATKAQKEQLYRLLEQKKINLPVEIEQLTRSEASRLVDKIRSGRFSA